jgi:hypothetical protein
MSFLSMLGGVGSSTGSSSGSGGTRYYDLPANRERNVRESEELLEKRDVFDRMLMFVAWSRDRNVVTYCLSEDGAVSHEWQLFDEPEPDRETRPLDELEEVFYGVTVDTDQPVMHIRALQSHGVNLPIRLRKYPSGEIAGVVRNPESGDDLRIDKAYVQFAKSAIVDVESITIYGTNLRTHKPETFTMER